VLFFNITGSDYTTFEEEKTLTTVLQALETFSCHVGMPTDKCTCVCIHV